MCCTIGLDENTVDTGVYLCQHWDLCFLVFPPLPYNDTVPPFPLLAFLLYAPRWRAPGAFRGPLRCQLTPPCLRRRSSVRISVG
jgi:hypothetical protein